MGSAPANLETFTRNQRFWLVGLLILALVMRVFALGLAWGTKSYGDPHNYIELARNLLAGEGLSLPLWGSPVPLSTSLFPPMLPILLAGVGFVAPLNPVTLCIVNTSIDCIAALLLVRLARLIGADRAAVPAALVYLLWPSIAFMSPLAYKEGLVIALVLATTVALLEQARRPGYRWAIFSGFAAGALLLTQPALLTLPPILFVALRSRFDGWREWWRASLVAAAAAIVIMLPWWVRNALIFDRFIPLTTSGGLSLWVGVQPGGGVVWEPIPRDWTKGGELQASQLAVADALQTISADPLGYLVRCLVKFPASFFYSNWAVDQLLMAEHQRWRSLTQSMALRFGPTLVELWVVAIALIGAIRFRAHPAAWLLMACIAQIMLFGIWFEFSERHRLFLTPFLLLAAAMLIFTKADSLNRRD